jgi:hypothetical protein
MELDEFKTYWKTIQDKEFNQQKLTKEKLDEIVMETAQTLELLQSKSTYWIKSNRINIRKLRIFVIPFLLIILMNAFSMNGETAWALATYVGSSIAYLGIILMHYFTTVWIFRRQQEIFTCNNSESLKETLTKTIGDFKRFYIRFNIIYLFLHPIYFYSVIKLITFWTPPQKTLLLTCALLTIVTLVISHLLYKLKYSDKIKSLKANLKELEENL